MDVAPGAPLPLALDARGPRARVEGVVRGAPPGAALQVDLRPAAPSPLFSFLAARVVDEQGRFAFPAVSAGRYVLRATWDDRAVEAQVEVRDGVPAWVDLTAL